jgi:AraC-like DNA-binding protein
MISINKKSNKSMNVYFVFTLVSISLKQLLIGILFIVLQKDIKPYLIELPHFSLLGLPIIYLYLKKLSTGVNIFDWKEFFKSVLLVWGIVLIISSLLNIYFDPATTPYKFVIFIIPLVFSLYYTYLCFKLLSKKIWNRKSNILSKKQNDLINSWTKLLFVCFLAYPIKFIFAIALLLADEKNILALYHYQLVGSTVIIVICFKIIVNPEILYGYEIINSKINESKKPKILLDSIWIFSPKIDINSEQDKNLKNKIDPNLITYIEKLEHIALEEELLIKPGITIDDIANTLGIPKSHINYLFKYHSMLTFIEFKKIIRIHYATKLIKEDFLKTNTLNSLSERVGFSSYDPFYRSFKKITGNGPFEYYNNFHSNNS